MTRLRTISKREHSGLVSWLNTVKRDIEFDESSARSKIERLGYDVRPVPAGLHVLRIVRPSQVDLMLTEPASWDLACMPTVDTIDIEPVEWTHDHVRATTLDAASKHIREFARRGIHNAVVGRKVMSIAECRKRLREWGWTNREIKRLRIRALRKAAHKLTPVRLYVRQRSYIGVCRDPKVVAIWGASADTIDTPYTMAMHAISRQNIWNNHVLGEPEPTGL